MPDSQVKQQRQKLDVEGTEERQARLGALLSSISTPSPTSAQPSVGVASPPSRPFAMPESSVLARVRDFLPMMASSNEALAAKRPEEVNMEDTEGDERVIAMDVNLGVFDVNGDPRGDLGPEVVLPESAEEDQDDGDDDMDEDEDGDEEGDELSEDEMSSDEETNDGTDSSAATS